MRRRFRLTFVALMCVVTTSAVAAIPSTQPATQPSAPPPASAASSGAPAPSALELLFLGGDGPRPFRFGAYAEVLYQWNFNNPSNRITNYRGFDNRHNTFTISNVALEVEWEYKGIVGRLALQIGHTPNTYYLGEPALPGTPATGSSGTDVWKYVQQAYAGYCIPLGEGLLVLAGIFLSPIGPEGIPIKDNWNWSRSNLFFGLPFYHTGAKLIYPFTDRFALTAAVYNGWNTVTDNNPEKSMSLQATYAIADQLSLSVLYFTGVERPTDAAEGRAWRHLIDAHLTLRLTNWLEMLVHGNAGFEPNLFGLSGWTCAATYLRFQIAAPLFITVRGDFFWERTPTGASSIFWPVAWVSAATVTFDYRPIDRISIRLEYRHDHGAGDMYFAGTVDGDGSSTTPFVPNRAFQDTLTLGLTAWR